MPGDARAGGFERKKIIGAKGRGVCMSSIRAGLRPASLGASCLTFHYSPARLRAKKNLSVCPLSTKAMRWPAKMLDDA